MFRIFYTSTFTKSRFFHFLQRYSIQLFTTQNIYTSVYISLEEHKNMRADNASQIPQADGHRLTHRHP